MQTKSNIQLVREGLAVREAFKDNIKNFMDKYTIEDSFFSSMKNATIKEHTRGYFVFEHEYTNIDEAVSNMTLEHALRIIDNKRFQIGKVYEKLSESKGEKVIGIVTGENISETENNDK